ncbi:MAG: hypothetical protein HYU71_05260 [Bacteroidetes bacterium]|nr:hypothetical protein [Bacteroidota bacterium]
MKIANQISFEEMETIEGGMSCFMATLLVGAVSAAGGAACAGTVGAGCAGGVAAVIYAYDVWQQSCGYSNTI